MQETEEKRTKIERKLREIKFEFETVQTMQFSSRILAKRSFRLNSDDGRFHLG